MAELNENINEGKGVVKYHTSPPSPSPSKSSSASQDSIEHNHTTQTQTYTQTHVQTHITVREEAQEASTPPIAQVSPSYKKISSLQFYPNVLIMDMDTYPQSSPLHPTVAQELVSIPTYNTSPKQNSSYTSNHASNHTSNHTSNSSDLHINLPLASSSSSPFSDQHAIYPPPSTSMDMTTTYQYSNNSSTPSSIDPFLDTEKSQLTTYLQNTKKENLPFSEWIGTQGCPDTNYQRSERL